MTNKLDVHFSSNRKDWETPWELFNELYEEFEFTLDVCSEEHNSKLATFFSPEDDGLKQDWGDNICWMNPPYGDPEFPCKPNCKKKMCKKRGYHNDVYVPGIIDWVQKAYEESLNGATVVCLLPARTCTKWFHHYVYHKAEIRFLKGRLKFVGAKHPAPFPSMIAVFRHTKKED